MKTMSEKEFFRLVPKTGWKLTRYGEMRRKIKGRTAEFCPITAVAHRKLGEFHPMNDYDLAAEAMGLSVPRALEIATAADVPFSGYSKTKTLRKKLLTHTRLTEIKESN